MSDWEVPDIQESDMDGINLGEEYANSAGLPLIHRATLRAAIRRAHHAERERDELRLILADARRSNYESAAASLVEEVKQLEAKLAALEKRIAESSEAWGITCDSVLMGGGFCESTERHARSLAARLEAGCDGEYSTRRVRLVPVEEI